ncbi:BadF/BadG/BcrA/BcrD ATPase family protein [Paenibacillus sp. PL91]|uniref:BadF/BadG/BcrA/BcrD ATPase family protein n=1 Tax=Paenibacillus sp. PL91 TaxID=2729538 RepID=UPI00145FA2EF|nr:BadF/BadG/BcrA/BcrD ATPase family protein [Paenibacillus sp. PL91]MBC9203418.1 ATPase [Paenibacillus sp. PL91]
MNAEHVVIGIDGGGTHTRVMVCDLWGHVLAYAERGSASFYKDEQASQNVQGAIAEALRLAGRTTEHVLALVAGIAGFDKPSDLEWIAPLTELPGLTCPKWHVNDAVSAHSGALMGRTGIIVIAGTGSIIVGITEDGQFIRNYDFHHYAASAARFIAYDAVYEMLAGSFGDTDDKLLHAMLKHWGVSSISELAAAAKKGFAEDRRERDKQFGEFAPAITEAAEQGSSAAIRVCNRAIDQIKVGIELLAASFASDEVEVAFIGSVANSPYFSKELSMQLLHGNNKRYSVVQPQFPPVIGSVLLALKHIEIPIDDALIENLYAYNHQRQH